jgi:flavodoxin
MHGPSMVHQEESVMKKIISILMLCVVTVFTMGCSSMTGSKQAATPDSSPSKELNGLKEHKTLIVYFSYTGNTRALAGKVHQLIGGDIVEIQTREPYSADYNHVVDQGKREVEEGFKPELSTKIDNFDQYDTILLGTPIWWYHMSPALNSFMSQYDFSGKTIVPFCTHGGYEGTCIQDMIDAAPGATVVSSFSIKGDEVEQADPKIQTWLRNAGLLK